ncbi:HAD family hydrolase [Pinisolibacter sp.]|uniref:HAD family hydrolase n=1 Tax=Pinisolibacter sp. TaxID=2172024 RepID=UPI002FDEBDC3
MPRITNVVFDFGNVLLRYDPRLLYDTFFPDPAKRDWFIEEIVADAWNREMDRGRPFAEGIAERVALHPEWETEIRAWDERWHEMVPGLIEETVAIRDRLAARGVPLYAITNFSAEKYADVLVRYPTLGDFVDIVVSAHEKLLKPDPAIYRVLTERNGLDPASCLFIDDVPANVEGARAIGMQAVRFVSPEQLARDLAALGVAVD